MAAGGFTISTFLRNGWINYEIIKKGWIKGVLVI
jgi:predicted DNA-binding transcriptional regulator